MKISFLRKGSTFISFVTHKSLISSIKVVLRATSQLGVAEDGADKGTRLLPVSFANSGVPAQCALSPGSKTKAIPSCRSTADPPTCGKTPPIRCHAVNSLIDFPFLRAPIANLVAHNEKVGEFHVQSQARPVQTRRFSPPSFLKCVRVCVSVCAFQVCPSHTHALLSALLAQFFVDLNTAGTQFSEVATLSSLFLLARAGERLCP